MMKVLNGFRTFISYFGAVCCGGYVNAMIHEGVNASLVLGLCLSALLAVVAGFMVKEG